MYSPKIQDKQVRQLFLLKMSLSSVDINKPMTVLVSEAIEHYIPKVIKKIVKSGGTIFRPDELGYKD